MAGTAKTSKFHFSTASVLVGKQSEFLTLNEASHSIGLVKNVAVTADPTIVDLTQGILNDVVDQQITGVNVRASFEVYEYTAKNLAYGMALDGTATTYNPVTATASPVKAAVAAGATTFTLDTDRTSDFVAGAYGFLQEGLDSYVHVFKVISSAFATGTTTVTITGYPVPTGMNFSTVNGRAGIFNKIDYNPANINSFLSCRIIGTMKNDNRPLILHFPKIRILKGFNLRFAADGFGNMPFEFTPYAPIASDVGYSADFAQRMTVTT